MANVIRADVRGTLKSLTTAHSTWPCDLLSSMWSAKPMPNSVAAEVTMRLRPSLRERNFPTCFSYEVSVPNLRVLINPIRYSTVLRSNPIRSLKLKVEHLRRSCRIIHCASILLRVRHTSKACGTQKGIAVDDMYGRLVFQPICAPCAPHACAGTIWLWRVGCFGKPFGVGVISAD